MPAAKFTSDLGDETSNQTSAIACFSDRICFSSSRSFGHVSTNASDLASITESFPTIIN